MKPVFNRVVIALSAIVLLSLLISACVQVEMESAFEDDGTGRHTIAVIAQRSLIDDSMLGGEIDTVLDFEAIEREAEAAGLDVERIDTADEFGIRVSADVEDNEDLDEVLVELFASLGVPAPPPGSFQGGLTQSDEGIGGSTYHFELTVDGSRLLPVDPSELDSEDGGLDDETGMDFDIDMVGQLLDLTYSVSLPGEITDHNGTAQGPGRVQWNVPLTTSETFVANSEEGSSFSLALIAGIGIGIVALVLIIIGGATLMRGQRTPTSAPVAGTDHGAQVDQSNQPVHPVTGQPDPVTEVEQRDEPGSRDERSE